MAPLARAPRVDYKESRRHLPVTRPHGAAPGDVPAHARESPCPMSESPSATTSS